MILSGVEILVLGYAAFLSSFHLFCHRLPACVTKSHEILLSFGGGSLLAIIFLVFLPETVHFTPTMAVYPLMLFGFVSFFISEKYLYQHVKDPESLEVDLYYLHVVGFFIDHFIKGFVLVTIIVLEPILGFLTAIPFFIHTLSSTIALNSIHKTSGRKIDKVFLSSSFVIGTLIGIFFELSSHLERSILAFILGMMLFMVSRDVIPREKEGRPLFFLLGVFTIFIIWISLEYIVI
ncbi:MAG: hypothetical protein V5A66_06285 [Candidatus Thermoplasmatota archaeon]